MPRSYGWLFVRPALVLLLTIASVVTAHAGAPTAPDLGPIPPRIARISRCSAAIDHANASSATALTVATCPLSLGTSGSLVIFADGSIDSTAGSGTYTSGNTEVRIRVLVDGAIVLTQYVDWVSYGLRIAVPAASGAHNVTLDVARVQGLDYVDLSGNLTVLGVPTARTDLDVCGAALHQPFTTTATTYGTPVYCAINAPSAGTVLILGSANQYFVDGPVEAHYQVGEAGVSVLPTSDRFVDVWANPNDGTDVAVTSMAAMPVAAGQTVEVGLMVGRSRGTATVGLREASVVGLFIPSAGGLAWCGSFNDGVTSDGESPMDPCPTVTSRATSGLLLTDLSVNRAEPSASEFTLEVHSGISPSDLPGSHLSATSYMSSAVVAGQHPVNQSIPGSRLVPVPSGHGVIYLWTEPYDAKLEKITRVDTSMLIVILPPDVLP